jgi:cbb3-type cytochrome oxidase subunit 3
MDDFRNLWTIVIVALFVILVVWVFWPRHKRAFEAHGDIPLRDDEDPSDKED